MVSKNISNKSAFGKKKMKQKIKEVKKFKFQSPNHMKLKKSNLNNISDGGDKKGEKQRINQLQNLNTSKFDFSICLEPKTRQNMLLKAERKWFQNETIQLPAASITDAQHSIIKSYASKLMEKELVLYKRHLESRKKRADSAWIQTVLKNGTVADRMAAMTLLIQDSPTHNLLNLDNLIALVNVKAKRECLMAIDTVRDLFLGDLLLEDRKLIEFSKRPFSQLIQSASGNRDTIDKHILLWHFEDELKKRYVNFVEALDNVSRDIVENVKTKAVSTLYELIVSKSENEQMILKKLVNKLGDPKHKIAAFAVQRLNRLVDHHPNMKPCIVDEVENLIFRTNVQSRAQYYGVCFLNQILLSVDDSLLASHLITIYFSFFKACVKRKEVNSKIMSALLTGVNRAYPYTKADADKINEQINVMFKVVQTVRFHIGIQALMLIYQVLDSTQSMTDRYYSALYRKILDPQLSHSTRLATFFNLLFKSMQKDDNVVRIQAFVKRLLQVAQNMPAPITCAILILISEIIKQKPKAVLFEQKSIFYADDEEEHFKDLDGDDDTNQVEQETEKSINNEHLPNSSMGAFFAKMNGLEGSTDYAPLKRNPRFANAEFTCAWELLSLCSHSHPTVALFAKTILNSESVLYTGDPLQDFTLIRFLDRFVYRNPKSVSISENAEKKLFVFGRRKFYVPSADRQIPLNSKTYLSQKETAVPIDEMYLYHYFSRRSEYIKAQPVDDGGSDNESVNSEEFEEYLSKYEQDANDGSNIDFASEFQLKPKRKDKRRKNISESESDYEEDFENDEEFDDAFKDLDEEIAEAKNEFNEEASYSSDEWEEDFNDMKNVPTKRKGKTSKPIKSKKFKKENARFSTDVDGGAEEFAEMMDENAASGLDSGLLTTLANKDNADVKQLKWEIERNRWIHSSGRSKRKNKVFNKKLKKRK